MKHGRRRIGCWKGCNMDFVAIDVETANSNMDSICQVGVVRFENGNEVAAESALIDPQTWFDPMNVSIHGIDDSIVAGADNFELRHSWLDDWARDSVLVCHTHFDRIALSRACARHSKPELACNWLDSARVARRTWEQFAKRGYGLANLAAHFGIEFEHHDALHDARTAGLILVRALSDSQLSLEEIMLKSSRSAGSSQSIKRIGDGDGALAGENVVFTGALLIPRKEAADRAAEAGADVGPSVTKKTSIVVVGDQDIDRLAGKKKSSKHIKAEKLIEAGQPIKIIGETDFMALSAITD